MELTAREIAEITGATAVSGDSFARARSWCNDSRALTPGACFVALVDARDGHDFVGDAFAGGATIALVTRDVTDVPPAGAAIVKVDDAFGALGGSSAPRPVSGWRARWSSGSPVRAARPAPRTSPWARSARKFHVHASPGSFNNEIGLPFTLLGAPAATEALVLEMGARFPGNIADLCAIARPDVGVITNIGLSHAGLLGGRRGHRPGQGRAARGASHRRPGRARCRRRGDDRASSARTAARVSPWESRRVRHRHAARCRRFPDRARHRVAPSFVLQSPWGSGTVRLGVRGAHQVVNASLAAAVALARGVPFDDVAAGSGGGGSRARAHGRAARTDRVRSSSTTPTTPIRPRWTPPPRARTRGRGRSHHCRDRGRHARAR